MIFYLVSIVYIKHRVKKSYFAIFLSVNVVKNLPCNNSPFSTILANPKSVILTFRLSSNRMFSGFKSLS